jgi:hyperosmotically inducible protein
MRRITSLVLPLLVFAAIVPGFAKRQTSDSEVTAKIQDKLYHAKVFQHGQVQVNFSSGIATLSGTVDSLGVKNDADRAVRKVDNVVQLEDNISIRSEDVTPRQVVDRARHETLMYPFYTIFDNIVLQTQGDKLIVAGQVTDPFKKTDIGNFLSHVKGVAELQNNLEVLPVSNFDDHLRLAIARAIFRDPYFISYGNQANPPIHIVVKNGNVALEGVVNSPVDRAKAETDARFAGTFFSLTNNLRVDRA